MATAAPDAPEVPLTQARYSAPTLECDIVMKGGITSGVVYPLAVCELAKTYCFRSVGGTSAGAIAAAATAAAEYGRRNGGRDQDDAAEGGDGDAGFRELARLPRWLGAREEGADRSHLFALFQPQPATDALFDVATASMRGRSIPGRLIERFPLAALLGALPGAAAAWLGTQARPLGAAGVLVALGVLLAVAGGFGLAGWMLARQVRTRLPANGFGLCSGNGPDVDDPHGQAPALTPWLADLINRLAGKAREKGPLTFGDLWGVPGEDGEHRIDLRFMTTSLTHGRPYELPFTGRQFFYDPAELGTLFPAWVMGPMNARAAEIRAVALARRAQAAAEAAVPDEADEGGAASSAEGRRRPPDPRAVADAEAQWNRLLPLPEAADMPVIMAARMSLSFPLLISAVPLYAVDYMLDVPDEERAPERCWFSDGGICSNFPVHFFDSPLPARPTFGINLRPFPADREKDRDEARNTWFPAGNRDGINEWFTRLPTAPRWTSLAGFGGLIVNAMQNWVDNTQLRVPGYRDRVAHVLLDPREGGLNLNMSDAVIRDLGERGRLAAGELARRFDPVDVPPGMPLTWDNHRWVRFRSSMQLLEELLREIGEEYDGPDPSGRTYRDLVLRGRQQPPGSYRLGSKNRAALVDQALRDVQALGFLQGDSLFAEGAPKPTSELRVRPRL
jgi:predicted acylesterase/phospholipase RssA